MTRKYIRRAPVAKKPTHTSIVEAAMKEADDFVHSHQLRFITGLSANAVSASLHHLLSCRAADSVQSQGTLWWFLTPDTDTRQRVVLERKPEETPRKLRRVRKTTPPAIF